MAIVNTRKIGNATVHTNNSFYAHLSPEELEKHEANVRQSIIDEALRILQKIESEKGEASN